MVAREKAGERGKNTGSCPLRFVIGGYASISRSAVMLSVTRTLKRPPLSAA